MLLNISDLYSLARNSLLDYVHLSELEKLERSIVHTVVHKLS